MSGPLISVLMPVYNGATTLPDCLDSIQTQSFEDFELLVVDDGSTDTSADIVRERSVGDPRIRLLPGEHAGIVHSLNAGLAQCRGRYVARMDADDVMTADRLSRQLEFAEQNGAANGEAEDDAIGAMMGARVSLSRRNGTPSRAGLRYVDWQNALLDDRAIRRDLFVESPISHPTFFARRALFEHLHGYRETPWAEDYDFLFRARVAGVRFAKLPHVVLHKGIGPNRLTRTDPHYHRSAMFRAKAHYFTADFAASGHERLIVVGTGPSGRLVAKAFRAEGLEPGGFVDNVASPPNRTVMGLPARGFPDGVNATGLRALGDAHFVLCVGEETGRKQWVTALTAAGYAEGRDYVRFI